MENIDLPEAYIPSKKGESAKETMCTGPGAVAAVPLEERLRQSLNQIPAVEKKAYLEALQVQSPSNLIEAESHPIHCAFSSERTSTALRRQGDLSTTGRSAKKPLGKRPSVLWR